MIFDSHYCESFHCLYVCHWMSARPRWIWAKALSMINLVERRCGLVATIPCSFPWTSMTNDCTTISYYSLNHFFFDYVKYSCKIRCSTADRLRVVDEVGPSPAGSWINAIIYFYICIFICQCVPFTFGHSFQHYSFVYTRYYLSVLDHTDPCFGVPVLYL